MIIRNWVFNGLVLIITGLLILSWLMPWWSCDVWALGINDAVVIHPYGLDGSNLGDNFQYVAAKAKMPSVFTPLMWTYFGLAIAVLLIGVFSKNKDIYLFGRKFNLSRWLIGIVGFSYIVVVICAVVIMSIRINAIGGLSLLGKSYAAMGNLEASWVDARLLPGYYLACCVGPLLILIALLRNKIKGKLQTE